MLRQERPEAKVKSFKTCKRCELILSGFNYPSMLKTCVSITYSYIEQRSAPENHVSRAIPSGIC
ncbi:protein of unknown function [Caballeronia sp. S22]